MTSGLAPAELPADAVEVGRVLNAWGVKGWFKLQAHSASPEALFSCRQWFVQPSTRSRRPSFDGTLELSIDEVREHGDAIVASAHEIADRNAAEMLKGARIFISRAVFPPLPDGEYYWVDLIGLAVVNREGVLLGEVASLMSSGAQEVLVVQAEQDGQPLERLIPFVDAWVDGVDLAAGQITVDWQPDY